MPKISLHRLRMKASIGILEHELRAKQALEVSIDVQVADGLGRPMQDDIAHVFDYRHLRNAALEEAQSGHVNLLETLASRIAQRLMTHVAVEAARVRVTKPDVFSDCEGASVEIELNRTP